MKVEYVDHMGTDLSVVNAARVSFDKVSEWEYKTVTSEPDSFGLQYATSSGPFLKESDAKLIRYLSDHDHWTPFAHTAITLRVGAPVPIRTQCFKHKQGFVENEESRRYISSRPELYVPDYFRMAPDWNRKQGSIDKPHPDSEHYLIIYEQQCYAAINIYQDMIADGIAPEQARFILPQGVIVNWIWTGNLYSYANFFNKRTDEHAQKEVREVAELVGKVIEPLFPVSWKALTQ
jgi:thymidylate synthase (FAD)